MTEPLFIIVDLFCGAGGTTTGFVQAELEGNQSHQKKFIGNSVVPLIVKKWTEALALKLIDHKIIPFDNKKVA